MAFALSREHLIHSCCCVQMSNPIAFDVYVCVLGNNIPVTEALRNNVWLFLKKWVITGFSAVFTGYLESSKAVIFSDWLGNQSNRNQWGLLLSKHAQNEAEYLPFIEFFITVENWTCIQILGFSWKHCNSQYLCLAAVAPFDFPGAQPNPELPDCHGQTATTASRGSCWRHLRGRGCFVPFPCSKGPGQHRGPPCGATQPDVEVGIWQQRSLLVPPPTPPLPSHYTSPPGKCTMLEAGSLTSHCHCIAVSRQWGLFLQQHGW